MKILVMLAAHEMNPLYISNIEILNNYLNNNKSENNIVDYCGISNTDDFSNYESIIKFKYKIINQKRALSKVCDFITKMTEFGCKNKLDYDWYIKMRPDFKLLEPINFDILSDSSINARARVYRGPQRVKYGMSINGKGAHSNVGCCYYDNSEKELILDDCVYIFHNNIIQFGAFDPINSDGHEDEWFHTGIWRSRYISLKLIGINTICLKHDLEPGHVNYVE